MDLSSINDESTPIDSSDPDLSGFHIMNHCIVLRPVHVEGKTQGGVILASKTHQDISYLTNVCKVLKLGSKAYTQDMFDDTGPWCKEGDFVLIPRLGGQKIKYQGVPLTLLSCDKVLAVLDDPKILDNTYNISTEGRM